jgi:hypothetical protein
MTYFDDLLEKTGGNERSVRWFRDKINELGVPPTGQLIREGLVSQRPVYGRMNFFFYDPKGKNELPYYDRFPLVMPIGIMPESREGFVGLNFHYLSIPMRLRLLNVIAEYATDDRMDDNTRIRLTWNRIKRNPLVKPTVKRYLASHVRSRFRAITAEEMMAAVLLPVQRFVPNGIENRVYSDSRRMANQPRRP